MRSWPISFWVFATTLPLFAGNVLPPDLGNGRPGLSIIYESSNEYCVFVDEALEKSWKSGDDWDADYRFGPIKILAESNFGSEKLDPNNIVHYNTKDLFPFNEQTVFTGDGFFGAKWFPRETLVFSANSAGLLLSKDVYALARARYGLMTNQWFLGKIGTNIFYWETENPAKVYFRSANDEHPIYYFKLPKAVDQVFGVKKAVSFNKDVGFCVLRKLSWFEVFENCGTAQAQPTFIEFSLKNAKH
ncbi:MAG TPA: hypothetical protein VK811_09630 [Candidatus Acidoferrum sp.]|jgi:hypothetical protein|nr:hypothetical protein [Candidatus Acidoferrum sp.]